MKLLVLHHPDDQRTADELLAQARRSDVLLGVEEDVIELRASVLCRRGELIVGNVEALRQLTLDVLKREPALHLVGSDRKLSLLARLRRAASPQVGT